MSLEFEWDPRKARANEVSHGVDFEEALTVFRDPLARIFDNEEHSSDEPREVIIGHSLNTVSFWFASPSAQPGFDRSARRKQRRSSVKTMRKTPAAKKRQTPRNTMPKEYRFDYSRAKPNRFAEKIAKDSVAVVLDPDVAARFKSSKAVNAILRSVLSAMPDPRQEPRLCPDTKLV
ncbi:MAG TPA: BrnT family toxin [Terriglobia bacterium]|nr:BrnT family toxin [Terriglobia bacterium]